MRVVAVIGFCVTFIAVMTAFVVLTLAGKDTTSLVLFASGAATTLLPQMLNFLNTHSLRNDVNEIKQRTNGPLTEMQDKVNTIAAHIEKEGGGPNAGSS